ncbi:hypothetical protein ACEZCY_33875 [Streptacidiphilus sp. N1-12]|uniref:Uncharacterized protein n=2 Tax=Streptacidiphilus alkalitolerans TaxID=3342712 RepID=A0ABV6VK81_9ACTN
MLLELDGRHSLLRNDLRLRADGQAALTIDARRLRFASPLDLAAATALAHTHSATGADVALMLSADCAVTSYLQRMDLLERLPGGTRIVGPVPFDERQDCSSTLLEITVLTPETADAVGQRIGHVAKASLGAGVGARVSRSIGELIDNAVSHGSGRCGAFIAAQAYSGKTTGYRRLEVAVCDTGIGVLEHLRRNPEHADAATSAEAMRRALRPGVSGTEDRRGNGLPDLMNHAGRAGPARLVLRSGDGLLRAGRLRSNASAIKGLSTSTRVDGTWAWLRVSFTP